MRFNITLYTVFLVIASAWAWRASLPQQDTGAEVERWMAVEPSQVQEVSWLSKEEKVMIRKEASASRWWVDYARDSAPPTAAPADPKSPAPVPIHEEERFLAGEKFVETMGAFNPMQVLRVVGEVKNLDEFGLAEPEGTFGIKVSDGKSFEFKVGKKGFGTQNLYLLDTAKKSVILVEGGAIDALRRARARLYERRLTAQKFEELTALVVSTPGASEDAASTKSRRIQALKKDEKGESQWGDEGAKATPKASYKSWIDKVERLRLTSFAKASDEEELKSAKTLFEIALYAGEKMVDKIVIKRGTSPDYWVTSEFLGTHGRLGAGRVEPIEKDLETVLP